MKRSSVFVVIMAVVILMAALSGCTSSNSPPAVTVATTPAVTDTPAPAPAVTIVTTAAPVPEPDSGAVADKEFVDATEACYTNNPVISDIATQQAFISCMQNTPDPKGVCALNYKDNILKYTKDDDTSAGYSRENTRIKLARDAYSKNLSYNYLTDKDEECILQPMRFAI
ncbi:MAG: hypothetical protein M0Q92_04310 [Methanoregula sp.]|jgi:hypothetical protein|nr:hypothetical protein [Methanoregula sp.]